LLKVDAHAQQMIELSTLSSRCLRGDGGARKNFVRMLEWVALQGVDEGFHGPGRKKGDMASLVVWGRPGFDLATWLPAVKWRTGIVW
jgi:hypothetical protein